MIFRNKKRKTQKNSADALIDFIMENGVEFSKRPDFQEQLRAASEERDVLFKGQRPNSDDYGYSANNPICTSTARDSVEYLSRLFTENGEKLYWVRAGAIILKECNGVTGVGVDCYHLYLNGVKYTEIYICPHGHNGPYVPRGLRLLKESDAIAHNGDLLQESQKSGMSVEAFLKTQQFEYENEQLRKERIKERENQAIQVQKTYAEFDLDIAMQNEIFSVLLECGVKMKTAYEYLHRDTLFYPRIAPATVAVKQTLTADDYYRIMYEFENSTRTHSVMPSNIFKAKKLAAKCGMTLEQFKTCCMLEAKDWEHLQQNMRLWAEDAVIVQGKYPEFSLRREYIGEKFRSILARTTMMTAYEVMHFQELYLRIDETKNKIQSKNIINDINQTYFDIFMNVFHKALSILSTQPLTCNAKFELLPAMFVIADYSCLSAKKNRQSIIKGLNDFIAKKYRFDDAHIQIFNERVSFYGTVIRGRTLRADWLPGQAAIIQNTDAIMRCATALGDILVNPECANDYDNTPVLLHDIFAIMEFSNIYLKEIIPLFAEFFKQIYDA